MEHSLFGKSRDTLAKIRHLWKLEDKEWVRQRKADWLHLSTNGMAELSAKAKREFKNYFLFAKKENYLGDLYPYFLAPFDSAEAARDVFWSDLLDRQGRKEVLLGYVEMAAIFGKGLSWTRDDITFFVEGVLGHQYQEVIDSTKGANNLAYSPDFLSENFLRKSIRLLKGEAVMQGYIPAIDYYVSTIKYADKAPLASIIDVDGYINLAKAVSAAEASESCAVEFAEEVCKREDIIRAKWATTEKLP